MDDRTGLRRASVVAGLLFITATGATVVSQLLLAPMLTAADPLGALGQARETWIGGAALEMANAIASAGIAIALFPILWRVSLASAAAYLGLRVIEGAIGVFAAVSLLTLLSAEAAPGVGIALAMHEWGFFSVLAVFSIGTLVLYPTLYRHRLVPRLLSLWGLAGGLALLLSLILILSGRIAMGSTPDVILSSPIFAQEMVLALWLILRGVDLPDQASR